VERLSVHLGVNRDGINAEFPTCADDPYCYLSSVGNQHLVEHEFSSGNTQWMRSISVENTTII